MLNGLSTQSPISLTVIGADSRVQWVTPSTEAEFGFSLDDCQGRYVRDILPEGEIVSPGLRGRSLESVIEHVLRTGEPVIDLHYRSPLPGDPPTGPRVWSCSYFRLQDPTGRQLGVCESAFDITERYEAQRRLELLSRSSGIGTTLDGVRTCEELVAVVVPAVADAAWADLAESVLTGRNPVPGARPRPHAGSRAAAPTSPPTAGSSSFP
ncbi:PAS domain-containing protein [Streptomyces sp. NPDC003863]